MGGAKELFATSCVRLLVGGVGYVASDDLKSQ
jgi:hypothetical protein